MAQVSAGNETSASVVEIDVSTSTMTVIPSSTDSRSYEVKVDGELDVATAPTLHNRLTQAFQNDASYVMVDLRDISFIDSTGIGVLVSARQRARKTGITMKMMLPQGPARFPFEITGLVSFLETH